MSIYQYLATTSSESLGRVGLVVLTQRWGRLGVLIRKYRIALKTMVKISIGYIL